MTKDLTPTTIVWDASNLAYRCRYTFNLTNRGENVSVIYGVVASIAAECKKWKPDSVVVCWDAGIPQSRMDKFPEYKAGRHKDEDPEAREDFKRQMAVLQEGIPNMGICSLKVDGYEADDLIYVVSKLLVGKVIIVTNDRDMLQMVSKSEDKEVVIYNPIKKRVINVDNFQEIMGIKPEQYLDYKIMVGDTSDHLGGIKGIGDKLASEILSYFNNLNEAVFAAKWSKDMDEDWPLSNLAKTRLKGIDTESIVQLQEVLDNAFYANELLPDVLDQIDGWKPYDSAPVMSFLMRHAFVSFMSGKLKHSLGDLQMPTFLEII